MTQITMNDHWMLYSCETTGYSNTTYHGHYLHPLVAICIGATKLTTQATSILSIEKPPTLLSAASHTGSSVSYVVWIRPSMARDNRGKERLTVEKNADENHTVLAHGPVIVTLHLDNHVLLRGETLAAVALAQDAGKLLLCMMMGIGNDFHICLHLFLLFAFFRR